MKFAKKLSSFSQIHLFHDNPKVKGSLNLQQTHFMEFYSEVYFIFRVISASRTIFYLNIFPFLQV